MRILFKEELMNSIRSYDETLKSIDMSNKKSNKYLPYKQIKTRIVEFEPDIYSQMILKLRYKWT